MSLDLYQRESAERMQNLAPAQVADVGTWDGFIRGTGLATMRGLAKVGRAVDLLGAVGPIAQDAFTGGTEAQDRYFREHDQVWGSAVDYWTPAPREVGAAAEITGTLLSTLPLVIAAPSLAIGSMQLSIAEDLVKKGVDPSRAQLVGASQALGLGLGIYMPIFGRTLTERILYGGIGFNLAQGIGMRAAGEALLKGTPGEGEFQTFGGTELTLDILLGAGFGAIVHLSPAQRAQGAEMWRRLEAWGKGVKPSDLDALAALRQAQHLNADSAPGRPAEPVDVERHAQRVRTAIEQLVRDEPVNVADLPAPRFEPDAPRLAEMAARARELADIAEGVRIAEGLAPAPRVTVPEAANLSPEQRLVEAKARAAVESDIDGHMARYAALKDSEGGKILNTDIARELFPEYQDARHIHSPSVHEPASTVVKEMYAKKLTEPDPNGLNMVTFTAGGTGAGKTSALGAVPLASNIVEASQVVYDTNMANFRSAVEKVDMALAAGKQANIVYVGADPVEAFRRALKRAMRMGRTVPLEEHAKTHRGSAAVAEQLMNHYRGNDRVQFIFLDNGAGAKGEVSIIEPQNAPAYLRSLDFDNLEARLKETLDAELQAGRISQEVHRGTAPASAEGAGAAARPGGAGEPAAGGEGRVAASQEAEVGTAARRPGAPSPESDALAANRGEAEPPPPRGFRGGEAAGAEGQRAPDPVQLEAERFVAEQPDLLLKVGEDMEGQPILKTAREFLDDVVADAEAASEQVKLFELAAACMLGVA